MHAIDNPDMAEKEISSISGVGVLTEGDRVPAADNDVYGDAGKCVW